MISALQFCTKMVNHFPSYCLRKKEAAAAAIRPYFLLDLQTILPLMGAQCPRIWLSEYKYPVECEHEYLTISFSCDINKPLLACHVFILDDSAPFRCQWSSAKR